MIVHHRKRGFSIVAVAEGALPAEGTDWETTGEPEGKGKPVSGQMGVQVTRAIEDRTGFETRLTILGYVQRGGTPTSRDRLLATRMGVAAIDAATAGVFQKFTALRGEKIEMIDLAETAGKSKRVPADLLDVIRGL